MKKSQIVIATALIVVVAMLEILVFKIGVYPKFHLAGEEAMKYAFDVAGVVQTLVSIPLGMRLRNRPGVWLALFAGVIHYGILVFFLFNSATTLACAAIGAVALLMLCVLPTND